MLSECAVLFGASLVSMGVLRLCVFFGGFAKRTKFVYGFVSGMLRAPRGMLRARPHACCTSSHGPVLSSPVQSVPVTFQSFFVCARRVCVTWQRGFDVHPELCTLRRIRVCAAAALFPSEGTDDDDSDVGGATRRDEADDEPWARTRQSPRLAELEARGAARSDVQAAKRRQRSPIGQRVISLPSRLIGPAPAIRGRDRVSLRPTGVV